MMKLLKNNLGASLVELLVSVGALTIVALASATIYQSHLQSIIKTKEISEASSAQLEIFTALSNEDVCMLNFSNVNPFTESAMNRITDGGTNIVAAGYLYSSNLKVLPMPEGIRRVPAQRPSTRPLGGNSTGRMDLLVRFENINKPGQIQSVRVPVLVETTANRVSSCSTVGSTRMECVYLDQSSGGTTANVDCPSGYRIVGGGISDTNFTKSSFYSHPSYPSMTVIAPTEKSFPSNHPTYTSFQPASGTLVTPGYATMMTEGELIFSIPASEITAAYDEVKISARGASTDAIMPEFGARISTTITTAYGPIPITQSSSTNIPVTPVDEDYELSLLLTPGNPIEIGIYFANPASGNRSLTVNSLTFTRKGTGSASAGGWRCRSDDSSGTLTCYAICCR